MTHIRAKKSLGQHFLTDSFFIGRIVTAARMDSSDQAIEIGPGLGHLTRELASRVAKLIVIELDDRMIPLLHEEFADRGTIEIVHADALQYDFGKLAGTWKIVANLPYYISTPIIQRLLTFRSRFSSMTLMLQREVAERISSPPGSKEYGYLSVVVQYYARPRLDFIVPPAAFSPPPKVDSAVVTLDILSQPAALVADEPFFFSLVQAAFSQRRKTLRNALKQLAPPDSLEQAGKASGIDLGRRAETLAVADFGRLAEALQASRTPRA